MTVTGEAADGFDATTHAPNRPRRRDTDPRRRRLR